MANIKDIVLTVKNVSATKSDPNVQGSVSNAPTLGSVSQTDVFGSVENAKLRSTITNQTLSKSVDDFLLNISINDRLDRYPRLFKKIFDDVLVYDAITDTLIDFGNAPNDLTSTEDLVEFLAVFNREIMDTLMSSDVFSIGYDKVVDDYLSNFEIISKDISLTFGDLVSTSETFDAAFDFQGFTENPFDYGSMIEEFLSVLIAQRTLQDNLSTANYLSFDVSTFLSDTSTTSDSLQLHPDKVLSSDSTTSQILSFNVNKVLSDLVNLTEDISTMASESGDHNTTDNSGTTEDVTFLWTALRDFLDTLNNVESFIFDASKVLSDISNVSETFESSWTAIRTYHDEATHTEVLAFDASLVKLENTALSETFEKVWSAFTNPSEDIFTSEVNVKDVNKVVSNPGGDTVIASDNFNRANGLELSTPWVQTLPTGPVYIWSNEYIGDGNVTRGGPAAYYNIAISNDQYSQSRFAVIGASDDRRPVGVIVRASGADSTRSYYAATYTSNGQLYFYKVVNGAFTWFSQDYVAFSLNDIIRLECIGSTIRVLKNGIVLGGSYTVTDTSLSTGKPGVSACSWGYSANDDWECGSIGSGTSIDTLTVTDGLSWSANNEKSEAVSLTETFVKNISTFFEDNVIAIEDIQLDYSGAGNYDTSETANLSEILTLVWTINRTHEDESIVSEIISKNMDVQLEDLSTISETVIREIGYGRLFTNESIVSETLSFATSKVSNENIVSSETLEKALSIVLSDISTLNDTLTYIWDSIREVLDNVVSSEMITLDVGKLFNETNNLTETFSMSIDGVYNETVFETEVISFNFSKLLTEDVPTSEIITKNYLNDFWDDNYTNIDVTETFERAWTINRSFQDNPVVTEVFTKSVDKFPEELTTINETLNKDVSSSWSDLGTISEIITREWLVQFEAYEYPTTSEVFTKSVGKVLQDNPVTSEVFERIWTALTTLNDTSSLSESIEKSFQKLILGAGDFDLSIVTDVLSWSANSSYAETLTSSETNWVDFSKVLSEDVLLTESFVTDYVTGEVEKLLEDFVDLTEAFNFVVYKELSENLSSTEILSKDISSVLSDNSVISEVFSSIWTAFTTFNDNTTSLEVFTKDIGKVITDNTTLSEVLLSVFDKFITDNPTITEIFSANVGKVLDTDNITTTEVFSKSLSKNLTTDNSTLSEVFSKEILPVYNETITSSEESFIKSISAVFNETVPTSEIITKSLLNDFWDDNYTNIDISETFTPVWTIVRDALIDTSNVSETIEKLYSMNLSENSTLSEVFSKAFEKILTTENITSSEVFSKAFSKNPATDNSTTSEVFTKAIDKVFSVETSSITEEFVKAFSKQLSETSNLTETFTTLWTVVRDFNETTSTTEELSKSLSVFFSDVVNLTEIFSNDWPTELAPLDTSSLVEEISKAFFKIIGGITGAQVRGSLVVNSSTDRIIRTANLPSVTNNTMAAWVKFDTLTSAWQYATSLGTTGGVNWLGVAVSTNNRLHAQPGGSEPSGYAVSTATWYYVAHTCSATDLDIWLWNSSGTLLFTQAGAVPTFTPNMMEFGNDDYPGGEAVYGKFCYGRAWDAVLSQSELEDEMFSETPVRTANLNTAFNNADGTDESGNGRNWTLTGITTSSDFPDVFPATIDTINTSEIFTKAISRVATQEDLITSEVFTKAVSKVATEENLITSEIFTKDISRTMSQENLVTSEVFTKNISRIMSQENLVTSEVFTKGVNLNLSDVVALTETFNTDWPSSGLTDPAPIDNPTITESGVLNLQNYVEGGYLAEDFVGTNTTF